MKEGSGSDTETASEPGASATAAGAGSGAGVGTGGATGGPDSFDCPVGSGADSAALRAGDSATGLGTTSSGASALASSPRESAEDLAGVPCLEKPPVRAVDDRLIGVPMRDLRELVEDDTGACATAAGAGSGAGVGSGAAIEGPDSFDGSVGPGADSAASRAGDSVTGLGTTSSGALALASSLRESVEILVGVPGLENPPRVVDDRLIMVPRRDLTDFFGEGDPCDMWTNGRALLVLGVLRGWETRRGSIARNCF